MADEYETETEDDEDIDELDDEAQRRAVIHQEAMIEFGRVQSASFEDRQLSLEDRRFYFVDGAQFDGLLFQNFDNKPKLQFNKVLSAVMRILAEYRNNPITVNFVAKDGDESANSEICDSLFRADMQNSGGHLAILNAFEEAVGGGMGAIRLTTVYEDEEDPDNDQQRIRIEPVWEADTSVYFDLDAKAQDKSDAKHCFVVSSMTRTAFEAEFGPAASPTSIPKDDTTGGWDWFTPDVVYIAEYYCKEDTGDTLQTWLNVGGEEEKYWSSDLKKDKEIKAKLLATGSTLVRSRRVKREKVHKYLISGSEILEDYGYIAGKCIPIIPVFGKRAFVQDIERFMGLVRPAKDPQRLFNMQASKLAELAGFSSMEKPIIPAEMIAGWETVWAEDNIKDNPYLPINLIYGADGVTPIATGPVGYTRAPTIPPAMAAVIQLADGSMKEILGANQEMQAVPANTSDAALNTVFNRSDMQAFMFVDNLAIGVKRLGEVWLSIARDIYVEPGRKMKALGSQNEASTVVLKKPIEKEGKTTFEFDFETATFDVVAEVGPSSSTRKQATVRALTEMLRVTTDPETAKVIGATIMLNTEGEGMKDTREWFRKQLVKMGAAPPTDEEAEAMKQAGAIPDPQAEYFKAAAAQAEAAATKDRASVLKILADVEAQKANAEKAHAQTLQILEAVTLSMEQSREEMAAMREAFKSLSGGQPQQSAGGGV